MIKIKKDKLYLVTGGSGFLGVPLCKRILEAGGKVRTIARDEGKLIDLQQQFPDIEILTGDISDPFEVKQSMKGIAGVFHLAASKHVGLAEKQVRECIKSNTLGSLYILEESLVTKPEFILGVSTDKAAKVAGVYGATKLLMERLLEQGKEVIVTDGEATRFFWTVNQAVDLIFECLQKATNYKPHITDMKSMSINNLLKAMSQKYLPEGNELKIKYIGLQPGENMHEIITKDGFSSEHAERFTIEEILELI